MSAAPDVLRWVEEGERLFGHTLRALQQCERVSAENRRLREELAAVREEVARLRAERIEAAESLRTIAEHVTRLATAALQRLGRPAS